MMISTDTEKAFDEIPLPFIKRNAQKNRDRNFLNLQRRICKNFRANIILMVTDCMLSLYDQEQKCSSHCFYSKYWWKVQ